MLLSPLRYPGGKGKLFQYFTEIVKENDLFRATYCEPYAGGAGLALKLLSAGFVERVSLNDIDETIYSFWSSTVGSTDALCSLIDSVPLTIDEWHRQKAVWLARNLDDPLALGFAAFFLNRTNRSGIIDGAGPIGGYRQDGPWRLDVRFNRPQLISQVQSIGRFADRISISNEDALDFVTRQFELEDTFCYLDPPYYVKGSKLYRNFYEHSDHCLIAELLSRNRSAKWIVSYDNVPEIRDIYAEFEPITYALNYSAGTKAMGQEVVYFSNVLKAPAMDGFHKGALSASVLHDAA
jgi:DNA adenine methylase